MLLETKFVHQFLLLPLQFKYVYYHIQFHFQALLKTNKWRAEYGVSELQNDKELIEKYSDKARVLRHRDIAGRPIIYIPAKNHSSSDRNIDDLTKFIVYCLVILVITLFFSYTCLSKNLPNISYTYIYICRN